LAASWRWSLRPEVLAWVALGLGAGGLLLAAGLGLTLAATRRKLLLLQGRARGEDILGLLASQREELETWRRSHRQDVKQLDERLGRLEARLGELARTLEGAVQRVGVVRYDAFPDMGGKLSFSAAFLNARGDGVVLSSINGRHETRTYAKAVRGGRSPHNLSDEEEEAIRVALGEG
jgi:hypothetical protein